MGCVLSGPTAIEPFFIPELMSTHFDNDLISRREALRRSATGFGNLAFMSLLAESGLANVKSDP